MILRGLRKYAHVMDRLGLGIYLGITCRYYPTTNGLTSAVHHQKGACWLSFGDGCNLSQARPWCQPFLIRATLN